MEVDKFIFPTDFIILDMIDDIVKLPLILGISFFVTSHAPIDVLEG